MQQFDGRRRCFRHPRHVIAASLRDRERQPGANARAAWKDTMTDSAAEFGWRIIRFSALYGQFQSSFDSLACFHDAPPFAGCVRLL